jgi:uracil phosphoribosyltransferase
VSDARHSLSSGQKVELTFRTTLHRLASLVGLEATSNIKLSEVSGVSRPRQSSSPCTDTVQLASPVGGFVGHEIGEKIGLAPILRSGVGMEDALLSLLPGAPVYHLGLYR